MMVGIPLVGRLYNYVQPRIMVAFGVALVALSAFLMSRYTLDTGRTTVVGAIIIQGFGFASLFVPLTTVALAHIPRYRLADAAGLNSLLRQIGGSLGLAAFATLLPRFTTGAFRSLAAHVIPGRPEVMSRLMMMQRGLVAHGVDPGAAPAAAGRALAGQVARQATVLAFERMFLLAGISFLFILPLAIFLKAAPGTRGAKPNVH
jgi:DHA2 family multidrug resistance protein